MFERFTDTARSIVTESQGIARDRGHESIDVEHLLLALIYPKTPDAVSVILSKNLGGMEFPEPDDDIVVTYGHIPFTPDSKKVMELSLREALRLGHNYIGTEHLVLGMCRMQDHPRVRELFNSYHLDPVAIQSEVEELVRVVKVADTETKETTTLDTQGKRHALIKGIMLRLENGPPLSETDLEALKLLAAHLGIRDFD